MLSIKKALAQDAQLPVLPKDFPVLKVTRTFPDSSPVDATPSLQKTTSDPTFSPTEAKSPTTPSRNDTTLADLNSPPSPAHSFDVCMDDTESDLFVQSDPPAPTDYAELPDGNSMSFYDVPVLDEVSRYVLETL